MNRRPDMRGICRYWKPGEDDRADFARATGLSHRQVDAALDGLWDLLCSRRRTKFVGFGVFEWRPWKRPLPTGRMVETWRLAFKPSKYAKKWKGDGGHGNR